MSLQVGDRRTTDPPREVSRTGPSWSGAATRSTPSTSARARTAVVGSLMVVVGEIVGEVCSESGDGGFDVGDEGRLVALFEDGALHSFGFAVGLGASGFDEAMGHSEAGKGVGELLGSELVAVVG